MELETQKIINLHKIDVRLQEIQEEKGDLPLIIKEQKDEISGLDSKMSESDSKITELEKEKSDCDTSVKDFEAKLDKYNKQMDMVTNNKEYDALLVEIDHLKNENNTLVDKILEIEESIEGLNNFKKECDEKITSLSEKLNENESELNEKSVEFDVEEKLLLKDKDSLLTSISNKKFLEGYNSDDKEMLASVYNGSCSSCYTNLPAQALVDAQKGVELIECPSCSIFLYFDEDR